MNIVFDCFGTLITRTLRPPILTALAQRLGLPEAQLLTRYRAAEALADIDALPTAEQFWHHIHPITQLHIHPMN